MVCLQLYGHCEDPNMTSGDSNVDCPKLSFLHKYGTYMGIPVTVQLARETHPHESVEVTINQYCVPNASNRQGRSGLTSR